MPIYEYICQSCGKECEILQKMSDPDPGACPHCGRHTLKKRISAAGFRLAGGGWYETDFKTKNKRNLAHSGTDSGQEPKKDGKSAAGNKKASDASKNPPSGAGPSAKQPSKSASGATPATAKPRSD